jgi:hypothetical protein
VLIERADVGCEPRDAAARKTLQHRAFQQSGCILSGNLLGAELAADGQHLSQPFDRRRVTLRRARGHDGDERGDHPGIDRIVLCQDSACPRELSQSERVDMAHSHAGRKQRAHDAALITTTRFDSDGRDRKTAQTLDQLGPTGGVIAHRKAFLVWQHHNVQTVLRHIDSAVGEHWHLRIPSLLMRARAQATVRVWKKRLELQAHSRFDIRGGCGLPVATGAVS